MTLRGNQKKAFSLLEVVIVVAIIAILAAIGIPRMSRGSRGAGDSALRGDLAVLRNAIDLYAAEHQGTYPTEAKFTEMLTTYTNAAGADNAAKTTTFIYGPYVRAIPALKVGAKKGQNGVSKDGAGANDGWVYTVASGTIVANTADTELDDAGVKYNTY
jgi:general secretion pathway protein G